MTLTPYNVYLTYVADPNNPGTQMMTLNALTNGYYSPPVNGEGNPPVVMQSVTLPCSGTAIVQTDAYLYNDMYYYETSVAYNLPDGSLLTFSFNIGYATEVEIMVSLPNIPATSIGSLYAVSYNEDDYQSSLNLTLYLND